MKLGNLMTIYYRQTRKYRLKGLAIIFLFTVAIVMIHGAVYEQSMSRYNITMVKHLFKERENLYNIKVWVTDMGEATAEGMTVFLENLKRLDGVDISGRFYNRNEIFVELKDNQEFLEYNQEVIADQEIDSFFLDIYYVDRDLASLLGVGELSRAKHGDIIPVLAGYDYKYYLKEGEIYTSMEGIRYEICGVLPEGFRFPPTSLLASDFPCEIMDNKLIALHDGTVDPMHIYVLNGANSIYCVTDGEKKTVDQIKELAKQSLINIEIDTIDELILQYQEDNKESLWITALFTGITVLAAFLAMISLSVIQILLKKQEYGILFANGISRGDGVKLIAMENGIRQMIAFVLGTIITAYRIESAAFTYVFQKIDIFKEMVVWKTFIIVLLLFIGNVSIPAILLGKKKTAELLGGNEL